jgi:MioC protein
MTIAITSPVQIIVGSMLGATEYVAESLLETLNQHQIDSELHFQPDFDSLPQQGTWLICSSTHGAGDLPDNIQPFADALKDTELKDIQFLTIGLGDTSYDTFCQAGKTLFKLMLDAKAQPLAELFCIDVLEHTVPEEPAALWLSTLLES